jgi:dihydroorotate dehydrogenase
VRGKSCPSPQIKQQFSLLCLFLDLHWTTQGLRALQQKNELHALLSGVKNRRDAQFARLGQPAPPLLVKIAPDLTESDRQDIADVCLDVQLDGLIISNTTLARPAELTSPNKKEVGGLSGAPLKHVSTDLVRDMYRRTKGRVVIIGVGGVETGMDAYAKIKAVSTRMEGSMQQQVQRLSASYTDIYCLLCFCLWLCLRVQV